MDGATPGQLVPRRRWRGLAGVVRRAQAIALRGDVVECPCCGGRFRRFLAYGRPRRAGARCPACGSLERHRATWLYLRDHVPSRRPLRFLDVAPAPFLRVALQSMDGVEYLSVDLESPLAMRNMDVTRLDLSDASFDIILCSHVLEHVPDDRAAMRELLRVLADDGFAMLQTPWDPGQAATDEDPTLLDPAERVRRFGQEDHVRAYGRDLLERLRKCGWDVELVNPTPTLDAGSIQRYGLSPDDPLLIGRRAR